MDDAVGVGRGKRRCQLTSDRPDLVDRHRAAAKPQREALALDEFHDDERAIALVENVVDGRDVRMIEPRGGARLAQDAIADRVARPGDEALERDAALEPRIVAEEHLPHAADAELVEDLIRSDRRTYHAQTLQLLRGEWRIVLLDGRVPVSVRAAWLRAAP